MSEKVLFKLNHGLLLTIQLNLFQLSFRVLI